MSESGTYLFAVAVSERFGDRPVASAMRSDYGAALRSEYGEVRPQKVDDMVALCCDYRGPAISEVPQVEIIRYLMIHQQVIEWAARRDFVLPVRLGTVVPDVESVGRLLRGGSELIHETWKRFNGHVEIDVAVTWDLEQELQQVARDTDVVSAKEAVAGAPPDEQSGLIVGVGKLVAAKLDERRSEIRRILIDALRPHIRDYQNNAMVNDTLVCNTAFLVPEAGVRAFDAALEAVDSDLSGKYNFRRVGPLPLYSFATLHVRELSRDRLEAARERLGLPEDYDESAVDRRFRELAVVLHPDANPGDDTAADRFEQLARARADLVMACQMRSGDAIPGPILYLSVERTADRA